MRTTLRNIYLLFTLLISACFFYSCEDSVSPNGPFSADYSLNCILNSDTTFQTAFISSSYAIENYSALNNVEDPALEGAAVTLIVANAGASRVYNMQEGTTNRTDTSRYKTPLKYYYVDNYKPSDLDRVYITANLKNGTVLKSNLLIPKVSLFRMNYFNVAPFNPINVMHSNWILSWLYNDINYATDYFFYYKLQLVYSKADNPEKLFKVKIPLYYSLNSGILLPIYPKLTRDRSAKYSPESVIEALNSISKGDPDKGNYIIHECEFSNQIVENNLAGYIYAVQEFMDEFSIRIDPTEASNIQNGYGIFGAYALRKYKVQILKSYINSLGYRTSY